VTMTPTPRMSRRAASRRALALVSAATAAGSLAAAVPAVAAPLEIVPRGAGLTAPTGVVETPDGALWVNDSLRGVCRIEEGAGVVEDLYCSDAHVAPHAGPIAGTGLAFDAASSSFYAGDIQSNNGAVWRLHWDAATGTIDGGRKIAILGEDRVTGVALAPATASEPASVLYTTKRTAAVMRIEDPAGAPESPAPVGFGTAEAPNGVAVLDGKVYLAEANGVRSFPLAGGGQATIVPGTASVAATAIAADAERGRIYVGTSYPELADDVIAIEPAQGIVETYERGFAAVAGLGVDHYGTLLVGDDPGLAAGNIDSAEQGRLYAVRHHALRRATVSITAAPAPWSSASSATFAYESAEHATFECRWNGGEWTSCDGYGSGSVTFEDLDEDTYSFQVRASLGGEPGVAARRVFVIDRTAPRVTVTGPADGSALVRGKGRVDMVADELDVAYTCAFDGGAAATCDPGQALPVLAAGAHTLAVTATDAAGNRSATATTRFNVLAPPVSVPTPVTETPATPAAPAPTPEPAAPAPAAPSPSFVPRGEVAGAGAQSAPRLSSLRLRSTRVRSARSVRVRLELGAGQGARTAQVSVRSTAGVIVVRRSAAVRAGSRVRLDVALSAAESRRLAPGRYVVTVRLADASGRRGNALSQVLRVMPS
jgi:hypothetical protein